MSGTIPRETPSAAAEPAAAAIHADFLESQREVEEICRAARRWFLARDWHAMQRDARERLEIHTRAVDRSLAALCAPAPSEPPDRARWGRVKESFAVLADSEANGELARTYFNSVARRLFGTVGVDPATEFTTAEIPRLAPGQRASMHRRYAPPGSTRDLIERVLGDRLPVSVWRDLDGDARRVAERVEAFVSGRFGVAGLDGIEVAVPLFFRNKGAYAVGRLQCAGQQVPFALPILHGPDGVEVDAVLLSEAELSILFSFTRSSFQAEAACPVDLILFLKSIMPLKPVAELYITLGFPKHGKTELYRGLSEHLRRTEDRFEVARGERGMVMIVFTLPLYDVVFKVIRDRFAYPKSTTRRQVMDRYRLVFRHDRVGRLVDAQEFERLTFERRRFAPALLDELLAEASETVALEGDRVVIQHLYAERRLTPLDLHLRQADLPAARRAVIEYGDAIKDLAAANIFPGDFLLKNFGVTRHGRVVFYDYDELCLLSECRFRSLPPPRSVEEEMSAEPWFAVGENDIFPEEFARFLGLGGELREAFMRHHADLMSVAFWRGLQERLASGEIMDFFPYAPARRFAPALEPRPA